jgi:sugar phosphate isomerase/epimerase
MSSVRWTLAEDLEFYANAGISLIGVTAHKLIDEPERGVERILTAGLQTSSVLAATVRVPLVDVGPTGALDALRPSIEIAAALGDAPCYFVSGPAPSRMPSDDAFELLVDTLAPVVLYARERGVTLAIETSSTSTRDLGFVHSLDDAVELSRRAEVGVCVELQNCWYDCHLRRTFREHVHRFAVVQVNDFTVGDGARLNRRVPGDGDMPVEWLLGTLLDAGYAGPFELEVVGPRIEEEGYPDAIARGLEWISERLRRWGA